MIHAKNISFSFGNDPLYEEASFVVQRNRKVGLVGLNGAGKSTLFQLILGEEWPEEGRIDVQGKVRLVPQEVKADPLQSKSKTVREYLNSAKKFGDQKYHEFFYNMELQKVSLDDDPSKLSGGQKTKLALLHAVLSEPDILLLDEPTNFMDIAGKKWVMHWLGQFKKTLIIVSHDLDLLDKHIHKVIYVNKQTKDIEEYTGTYSKFKKLKADRDEHLTKYIKNQEQKIKRMQKSIERLKRSNVEKVIRQRVQLEKRMNKMQAELPQLPQEIVNIKLQLPEPAHVGSLPVLIKNISKSYGDKEVLKDVSFSIAKGQRVALIGHNGVGKSTLIKIVMEKIQPDSGRVILDDNLKVGYYSQELEQFDMELNLYETVQKHAYASEGKIRAFLAKFMFTGNRLKQKVGSLSGGEKTRLAIALLMIRDNNLLVLDEPTTYLDVLSQRVILEALKEYKGAILVVSHTPDFLIELQPEKAILLPDEQFRIWDRSYVKRVEILSD